MMLSIEYCEFSSKGVTMAWRGTLMFRHDDKSCCNLTLRGHIFPKLHTYDNSPALKTSTEEIWISIIAPPTGGRKLLFSFFHVPLLPGSPDPPQCCGYIVPRPWWWSNQNLLRFHTTLSPWRHLIRHKTRGSFWGARDTWKLTKLGTPITRPKLCCLICFLCFDVPRCLNSAPYNFSMKQPPKLVSPTCMKLGRHM